MVGEIDPAGGQSCQDFHGHRHDVPHLPLPQSLSQPPRDGRHQTGSPLQQGKKWPLKAHCGILLMHL